MKKTVFIALLLLTCANSKSQVKQAFPIGHKIAIFKKDPAKIYFPKGKLDDFTNKWYSIQLIGLGEPVLYDTKSTDEIYRFTWLRSFDHPIAISIIKKGNSFLLTWKECNGSGGHEPGKIIMNKQRAITKADWDFFQYRLKQLNFWQLPTTDPTSTGADGAKWLLEGKKPNQYHVTDRWTPGVGTDYYKCCDLLLSLTDLKIKSDRKY